ncbi:MAG: helix-turn-helix domain-containing protein [Gammaproteobacteria bacterium]|nr:helix-turn-helix domain-containing protein [Gammaproteobacteria bacterium]
MTPAKAAEALGISVKTLTGHVKDGELRYVNVGRGSKKPRRMFDIGDLTDFKERRTRREMPCRSISRRARPSTNTTSKCEVVAFTALQNAGAVEKRKR